MIPKDTGDIRIVCKAHELRAALYELATRSVGRAPFQDVFETEPHFIRGLSKGIKS